MSADSRKLVCDNESRGAALSDREEYAECFGQLSETLRGMVECAEELSRGQCLYKNRSGDCTAEFGCRNQRRASRHGLRPSCRGDSQLNYHRA